MSGHYSPTELLLAEVTAAGFVGQVVHVVAHLPGWVGGIGGGLVVGVLLRLLDPTLKAHGERLKPYLTPALGQPAFAREVIVVDDHPATLILTAAHIRDALGVRVHEAHNAAEARGLAQMYRPMAVVCDMMLPDDHGEHVLKTIGRPGCVLTSGVADADALDAAAARCGAIPMRKPVERDRLIEAVRALLG